MERLGVRDGLLAAGAWALLTAVALGSIGYIDRRGFNPSDDGVVLAQSYRVLQGQIPHRDFVSIRPALSGLIHTVHFTGILPLVESGRILVLLEIFLSAFVWAGVLCRTFDLGRGRGSRLIVYSALGMQAFILGLNSGILFPWTTIDAITFAVLGFAAVQASSGRELSARGVALRLSVGVLLGTLAMLCRQSFAAVILTLLVLAAIVLIRSHRLRLLPIVLSIGLFPLAAYLGLAAASGAWAEMWRQLGGRHELLEVGVGRYVHALRESRVGWILLAALSSAVLVRVISNRRPAGGSAGARPSWPELFLKISVWGFAGYALLLALLTVNAGGSRRTFELFWSLSALFVAGVAARHCTFEQKTTLLAAVVLGWTGSISIGANSPLLAMGIMTTSALAFFGWFFTRRQSPPPGGNREVALIAALAVLAAVLVPWGISRQLRRNYRDRPARELTYELGRLVPAFGGIRTNARTYDYYRDLIDLYNRFPGMKDHMVVVPNNAIIYPVLRTRNPFPLDWPQKEEFVGSQARVRADMATVLTSGRIYVLIEKCDSKRLDEGLFPSPKTQ